MAEDLELLSRLHAFELDLQTLESLIKGDFPRPLVLHRENQTPKEPIEELLFLSLQKLKTELNDTSNIPNKLDELSADFAAIYLNVSYHASPNESPWLDEDGLEKQEPMFQVRNWYAKYGLKSKNWRIRSDDNLSLQLLFMAHLLRQKPIPWRDMGTFMDFHLLRWIRPFAEKIFQRADTAFYSGLALLTAKAVENLRVSIEEVSGIPRTSKKEVEESSQQRKPEALDSIDPSYYLSNKESW